ncbi:MAG: 50S ribosomal protein L28 [candidate division WOR-3 bacterium]|nr:MAG: 50S ribosomal protein L28 [candidate division WOR-3 bacterium]
MARVCAICGRGAQSGSSVSHSQKITKRRFKVNLQRVRVKVDKKTKKILVCTRCLRSGRATKA